MLFCCFVGLLLLLVVVNALCALDTFTQENFAQGSHLAEVSLSTGEFIINDIVLMLPLTFYNLPRRFCLFIYCIYLFIYDFKNYAVLDIKTFK